MKTVKIIILFFSILYYQTSFSQAKENFILKVINDQNIGIYDAVVLIDDAKPMLTDENGNAFLIVSTQGSGRIIIKHLSYIDFDTIVNFPLQSVRIVVKLKSKNFVLDEVTLTADLSITEKQSTNIIDMYLHDDHILTLFAGRKKNSIKIFDSLGIQTGDYHSFIHDGSFSKLEKGYQPSSFYLVGSKMCLPFNLNFKPYFDISEQQDISVKNYSEAVREVVLYDQKQLIKKVVSAGGNLVKLYKYDTQSLERQFLYEIFDRKNAEIAVRNYNKVKGIYLRSIHVPDEKDIDFGFQKNNVLEDPNWNGDILDLYVRNDQKSFLNMYQMATQGLNIGVKIREQDLWLVDNVNKVLVKFVLNTLHFNPYIPLPESKSPFKFVLSDKLICIENGNAYYYLDETVRKWISMPVDDGYIHYPKRKILLGGYLYVLGRSDARIATNTIMKFKVF